MSTSMNDDLDVQSVTNPADFEDQMDRQTKELVATVHQAFKETIEVI